MVTGEIKVLKSYGEHYFAVARFGERKTFKYFSNLRDATKYYDSLCMRNKGGASIWLYENRPPNYKYATKWIYNTDKGDNVPFRDVSEKSKSSTTGFGFPKPKKDSWPNIKV